VSWQAYVAAVAAAAGAAATLLAGCAGNTPGGDEPTMDTGTLVGEVGDPRNRAKLHTELAAAYYQRGTMGVALEELRAAVAADSSYAPAHGMFGVVYMELRENQLAEQSFERALRLAPNDPDINHNFGWFLCQTKREPDSIKYFMQAVRNPLYPAPWRSYSAAGQCTLRTNNVKDAEDFFGRALKLDPDEPLSLLQMGQIRYRQGRIDEARKLAARYNKLVTPTAESLWLALRVERKAGERVAETAFANQLRRRFAGSPEYQLLQKGQFD
jgi:type IV pilus assembly protein PilF